MKSKIDVLIVDDDEWFAKIFINKLNKQKQIKVLNVVHGYDAIDVIDCEHPKLIILDLFLSGPNGLALLHEIKSYDDLAQIPIIIWSSMIDNVDLEVLRQYGVIDVIDKSKLNPDELIKIILHIINGGAKS